MRIQSIRLHPFGGTSDRTYTFNAGLNVLEGPNEAGKSTLCNALYHALFTPTDLTPAKFQKVMGRFLPRPNGDHARVTLVFRADGIEHTLIRTWGAKAGSELVLAGQPPLGDAKGVQERIRKALRWNEATWEQVLFINQARLNQTLHQLERGDTDDIGDILRRSGRVDGDIPAERIIQSLENRIADHYGRWDRQYDRPEGGRGIDNPWNKGVGPVLKAWYAQEELRKQHDAILQYERDLDAVNGEIARIRDLLHKDAALVQDGHLRKDGLNRRAFLEQALAHRQDEIKRLMKVMTEWPGAAQVVKEKKEAIQRCEQDLEKLKAELANAKKHQDGERVRALYQVILENRKALEEAQAELARTKLVSKEQVEELRQLQRHVEKIEVEIKAQKLAATLEASAPVTVQVDPGGGTVEQITLGPGESRDLHAEGRITIVHGPLRIGIRSDQKDVEQLFRDLEVARSKQAEFLKTVACEDLAELIAGKEVHDLAQRKVETCRTAYSTSLQNRTQEQWEQFMEELAATPAARSLAELEKEREVLTTERARHVQEEKNLSGKVDEWTRTHTTVDALMGKVVDLRSQQQKEEAELAALPTVPLGYADAKAYLAALQAAEAAHRQADQALNQALLKQSNLQGRTPESTAEELREELDLRQRLFTRQLHEARAYERILARVRALAAHEGPDPLAGLAGRVEHFVHTLSDGKYTPQLQGTLATGLMGTHPLENEILSQGTQGVLALAIRLAYAEIYLGEEGFMVMDDPLTDMDPQRRLQAAKAFMEFAGRHQIILLTCHPEHADVLAQAGGTLQTLHSPWPVA
jgi:DNA repair protein SbcC/Rad50